VKTLFRWYKFNIVGAMGMVVQLTALAIFDRLWPAIICLHQRSRWNSLCCTTLYGISISHGEIVAMTQTGSVSFCVFIFQTD
jgi:hypothetical protein